MRIANWKNKYNILGFLISMTNFIESKSNNFSKWYHAKGQFKHLIICSARDIIKLFVDNKM